MKDKIINSISIILPIYNEEKRLKKSLNNFLFIKEKFDKIKTEFILINDGSSDDTDNIIKNFIKEKKNINLKYISYKKNNGKGFALKKGVEKSKNQWVLTCDIDFSTNPLEVLNWIKNNEINEKNICYFGSRKLKKSKIEYLIIRKFMGLLLSLILKLVLKINTKDTQCGFKMYYHNTAKKIFKELKEKGFSHDIEIILIAKKKNFLIKELPVTWTHKDNSKINIFIHSLEFLYKIFILKIKNLNV
jgi:dolichyl-phosphate beta-glucosyltransferase